MLGKQRQKVIHSNVNAESRAQAGLRRPFWCDGWIVFTLAFGGMKNTLFPYSNGHFIHFIYILFFLNSHTFFTRNQLRCKTAEIYWRWIAQRKKITLHKIMQSIRRERKKNQNRFASFRCVYSASTCITFAHFCVEIFIRISPVSSLTNAFRSQQTSTTKLAALKIAFSPDISSENPTNGGKQLSWKYRSPSPFIPGYFIITISPYCARFQRPFLLLPSSRHFLCSLFVSIS